MSVRSRPGRRIGIFGGTFDPPHIGHLVAALEARDALALDVVRLVVAGEPWQKVGERAITPATTRLALVRAAAADVDGLEVSDAEVRRGGATYTADTLAAFAAEEPGATWFVIVGADAAAGFATWERHAEVAAAAELVVVDRPGADRVPEPAYTWHRVDIPGLEISSTDLRARVAAGRSIAFLTPPAVVTEIARSGLYPSPDD